MPPQNQSKSAQKLIQYYQAAQETCYPRLEAALAGIQWPTTTLLRVSSSATPLRVLLPRARIPTQPYWERRTREILKDARTDRQVDLAAATYRLEIADERSRSKFPTTINDRTDEAEMP